MQTSIVDWFRVPELVVPEPDFELLEDEVELVDGSDGEPEPLADEGEDEAHEPECANGYQCLFYERGRPYVHGLPSAQRGRPYGR